MRCYKFCLWKAYFEKGYGLTSYIKWVIAIFGITTQNVAVTLLGMFIYGIVCFFLGWAWYHFNIITSELEVQNQFNLFVQEMRKKRKV